jgi:hypothetical protein
MSKSPHSLLLRPPALTTVAWQRLRPALSVLQRTTGRRFRAMGPARWFLLLFAVLLLAFLVALLFAPTVGRGGR